MKQAKYFIILILLTQTLFAQKKSKIKVDEYTVIDKKALQLPDSLTKSTESIAGYITTNFISDKEKVRAIFIWIASNIQFDVENMYALNFYEKKEDKITKPLKTRKGICENYAELFNDICLKTGIKSYVIEGYTIQYGFADYIPHAWCAAKIDSSWFMFDPTWGSGIVKDGAFFKKINNSFFMATPASFIKSHMPFDYLWQFLNYPITNQDFYDDKTQQDKSKPYFNYSDSIQLYEKLSDIDQVISSGYRIEKNGIKNSLIFDRLQHIKVEIENHKIKIENEKQAKIINTYNSAVTLNSDGINDYNEFIQYKNKQFTPIKADTEIQKMLDLPERELEAAKKKLAEITNPDTITTKMISQLTKAIDKALIQVAEEKEWLKAYFAKGKYYRKSMFYKVPGQ